MKIHLLNRIALVTAAMLLALNAQADLSYADKPLFYASGAQPNVALLLDTSGSMSTQDAGYGPITNNCATSGTFGSTTSELSRFQALKTAACKVVQDNANAMRVATFGYAASNISSVNDWGASIATLKTSIGALGSTSVGTPIVRSLYAASRAYRGQLTFSTPIQYRCQKNYVVFFTDGEPNDSQDETSSPTFATVADAALDSSWAGSGGLYSWDGYPDPIYSGNTFYSSKTFYPWLDDVAQFMYDTDFQQVGSAATRACPTGSVLTKSTNSVDCANKSWDDPAYPIQNLVTYMVGFGDETNIEMLRDTPLVNQVTISGSMVDAALDTLTIPSHGLKTDDYVHYYAQKINQTFTTTATANTGTDTLSGDTTSMATGDVLTYSNGGGATLQYQNITTAAVPAAACGAIGGLTSGSTYYVARRTADTYRLAVSSAASYSCATAADANANVGTYCINLTSRGTALTDHAFARTNSSVGLYTTNAGTTPVNQTLEMFTITGHGLNNNEQITYYSTTPVGGLANATSYYVVRMSADTFKLATSLANVATCAADVTAPYASCVLLTSLGNNGQAHEFRRTATAATPSFTATNAGTTPVDITANTEKVTDTAHGLNTGDRVTYTCTNYPGAPAVYTSYNIPATTYAIVTSVGNPGSFKLASSAANAASNTAYDISNGGSASQNFTWSKLVDQPIIPGLQAYVTDLPPDSTPTPGTENPSKGKYWVEKIDNNTIKLYECAQYCQSRDAAALVNLTGTTGSGILSGGPGKFYLTSSAATLSAALTSAFTEIRGAELSFASLASNSSELTSGSRIYQARFNTTDWSGDVRALQFVSGEVDEDTPTWEASNVLPVYGSRNIRTRNSTNGAFNFTTTNWASLTTAQQTALHNGGTATVGQNVMSWVRGQAVTGYRTRDNGNIGDVLNSSLVYVGQPSENFTAHLPPNPTGCTGVVCTGQASYNTFKATVRTPVVFGGSNGGMMHGFDASTTTTQGTELIAFIPEAVYMDWVDLDNDGFKDAGEAAINKFYELAQPYYGLTVSQPHRYFTDGTPTVGDAYFGTAKANIAAGNWHTVLVAGLGKGGRSVFAMDVTNNTYDNTDILWEFNDANSGDMGYSYSKPAIARLYNGQWVAIFGNGYDSRLDQARMYIVNIETGALIQEITLGTAGNNGLSSVSVLRDEEDVDGDGDKVEAMAVYAGDLQGNVWKVNISSSIPTSLATPFFVAQDTSGNRQAITSEITLQRYDSLPAAAAPGNNGVMLFFGTGTYFRSQDQSYTGTPVYDSMYGLWDKGDLSSLALTNLVQQQMGSVDVDLNSNGSIDSNETFRTATANDVDYEGVPPPADRGWYMKLAVTTPSNVYRGERSVFSPTVAGTYLIFSTVTPADIDPCEGGGSGSLYVVDALTGGSHTYSPFDLDEDGDNLDENVGIVGIDYNDVLLSKPLVLTDSDDSLPGDGSVCVGMSDGGVDCQGLYDPPTPVAPPTSVNSGRMSWRQLQ